MAVNNPGGTVTSAAISTAIGAGSLDLRTAASELANAGFKYYLDFISSGAYLTFAGTSAEFVNANLAVETVGNGLQVKEGSNAKQGISGSMTSGAVTVANTSVTANSRIFVARQPGGTNPGAHYVSTISAGTSFVITSTNAADTGTSAYEIFEPAP